MKKELNPQLFSNQEIDFIIEKPNTASKSLGFNPNEIIRTESGYDRGDIKHLEEKLELKIDRHSEAIKSLGLKYERLQERQSSMEQKTDSLVLDMKSKYSQLTTKVSQSAGLETEIKSLLERHNQVVRNFENRLLQIQKHNESQQIQLMNYSAALDEARREIARLKKL